MLLKNRRGCRRSAQRGFSVLESMLSMVVGSISALALVQVDLATVKGSASAKVRSEAIGLAEQSLEQMRGIDSLAAYQALASSVSSESVSSAAGDFSRSWVVTKPTGSGTPAHAEVAVTVAWQDSDGVSQSVVLNSKIAQSKPEKSGQWYVAAAENPDLAGPGGGAAEDPGDGSGDELGGGETGGGGTDVEPGSSDPGTETTDPDSGQGEDQNNISGELACNGKEIVGNVIGSGGGQANNVQVQSSAGTCTGVSGGNSEASFSCAVSCTGTVTLTFTTSQNGASVSPATANFILDEETSPMSVTVQASK